VSSVAAIPPPNSSSMTGRLRHIPRLTAQARALLTAMNLHFAGIAALGVLVLYLAIHLVFVVRSLKLLDADAIQGQRNQLRAAQIAAIPLRGLDVKLVKSTEDADKFYAQRLPYAYSQVAADLGALTKHEGVRLSSVQYGGISVPGNLNEVDMDASIAGDYRPVVQFINAVERDKMFFVIRGINLSGQQTGQVNLRIHLTTYLREPTVEESTKEMPNAEAATGTGAQP